MVHFPFPIAYVASQVANYVIDKKMEQKFM